jgi:hypothetical protein
MGVRLFTGGPLLAVGPRNCDGMRSPGIIRHIPAIGPAKGAQRCGPNRDGYQVNSA